MSIVSLRVAQRQRSTGRLVVSQRESGRRASWSGSIYAQEPIVAMCFLQHGEQLHWARSPTRETTELPISLAIGAGTEIGPSGFYVAWGIGGCQTQLGIRGIAQIDVPHHVEREIALGEAFHFADAAPGVCLFGLVLPKAQVKGKRNHLWALKDEYLDGLSARWRDTMTRSRTGCFVEGTAGGA